VSAGAVTAGRGTGVVAAGAPLLEVLVAGNPNSGKSTLFNALTGASAKVSNYPGVTVSRTSAVLSLGDGRTVDLVDLPGTYSLSARSRDEQVAVDALIGRTGPPPAAVVIVADASALARSLYLVVEVLETSVPVVVALSMMDEARDRGFSIDVETLTSTLGAPVVPVVAPKGEGLGALRDAVARAVQGDTLAAASRPALPPDTEASIAEVVEAIEHHGRVAPAARRALASWLLLSLDEHGPDELAGIDPALRDAARRVQRRAASDGRDLDREIIGARYAFVDALVARSVTVAPPPGPSWTERIDGLLTHRVWGFLVFAVVMLALFQALFSWSEPAIGFIEAQVTTLQNLVTDAMPEGLLRDLLVNGVIAGVGNVLVFVPQIALLFLFIAVMEDVGYLARVAFVIDRVMGRVGLHGKSFVPMLSGFSCAVPAVLATRTLEHRTDRLLTMMVLPLMSCSARLPIYVLVIATVFDTSARVFGLMSVGAVALFAMYMLSVTAALGAAAVLRRTVLRGPRPTLLLELPPYRTPVPRVLLRTTWQQVRSFLLDAGTIILALTIILWALLSFPRDAAVAERYARERAQVEAAQTADARDEALRTIDAHEQGEQLRHSVAGQLGRAIEPLIEPLGYDWRIGVGIIGAFAAREVFVSTMGVVFGLGEGDEENQPLREALRGATRADGTPLMTPLTGVSLMVFFVLACQCMSTIAVVRRESGAWRWPLFMFGYQTALAYVAALLVYQGGQAIGF
jgi:ferrous iron transport protein B